MKLPVNRDSDAPLGVYQVWQQEGDGFRQVGGLKVANLLVAAEVAMNREPAEWMHWDSNEGKVPDDARRTQTGDVIVSPDGGAFKLVETTYGFTFAQVDFGQLRREVALFAEWRQDYAAAKERDGRVTFGEILHGPGKVPVPEPPEKEKERER